MALLTFVGGGTAAAAAPSIVGVSIASDPGPDRTYAIGDEIEVAVQFDEDVVVEGSAWMSLQVGDAERKAGYRRGSGSSRLAFGYEVAAGDLAELGVAVPSNGLQGGELGDGDGNAAKTEHAALEAQPGHLVDGVAPRVTAVEVVSKPPAGGVYGENDAILVKVTFDSDVHWVDEWQWIRLYVDDRSVSAVAVNATVNVVVFRYLIEPEDAWEGIVVGRHGRLHHRSRWLGIRDPAGNPADTSFAPLVEALSVDGSIADTTPPAIHDVSMVSLPRDGSTYRRGESIRVRVTFTEPLHLSSLEGVNNSARYRHSSVALRMGESEILVPGWVWNKRDRMVFHHVVEETDLAPEGLGVSAALNLGGGIADAAGNAVEGGLLEFDRVDRSEHAVNGVLRDEHRPQLTSAEPFAWAPPDGVRAGHGIGLRLSFDGVVEVVGTPEFVVGEARRLPAVQWWSEGLGVTRSTVRFVYEVVEDDLDVDGFSIPVDGWSEVSFRDQWGNPVAVDVAELAMADFGPPIIGKSAQTPAAVADISLSMPSAGGTAFAAGETIRVAVAFDKGVSMDGPMRLRLGDGESPCELETRFRLVCERVVRAGESASDVRLAANALQPSDALTDDDGNAVDLDLAAFVDDIAPFSVDGSAPSIRRLVIASRPAADHTYGAGARIDVVVRFDEAVRATGAMRLALVIGDETRLAPLVGKSGADGVRFRYVVSPSDVDANGLRIPADAIQPNGGAITDFAGNPAALSHEALSDRRLHQVDGSVRDDSVTPVQIRITARPARAAGVFWQDATSSMTWEIRSTRMDQPSVFYSVTSDHPDVRIEHAGGRVGLGEPVTNSLALSCPRAETVRARLTVSVGGSAATVAWNVRCRDGVRVREVEFFQGPLSARFGDYGVRKFAPAIAGRPAVLRLHVEHGAMVAPEVAVAVRGPGGSSEVITTRLSRSITGTWGRESSYVVRLPPTVVSERHSFEAVVGPLDELDVPIETGDERAFRALSLESLPVFRPVLVPVSVRENVPDMAEPLDNLARASSLLPIADMDARVGDAIDYVLGEEETRRNMIDSLRLYSRVQQAWNERAAPDEFYVGIYSQLGNGAINGANRGGGNVSVNINSGAAIPHETGHNFGLWHAPCGGAHGVDPDFPYADGGIGPEDVWSFHQERFISPDDGYFDLMGYCNPKSISEYHYEKAIGWGDRVREALARNVPDTVEASANGPAGEAQPPLDMAPSGPRSLALSGSVDRHGVWSLYSSAPSPQPARNDVPGGFTLTLHDDAGVELYRQSLATEDVSHGTTRTWAVRVPIQSRPVHAARIRDTGGGLLLDATVDLPGRGGDAQQPLR